MSKMPASDRLRVNLTVSRHMLVALDHLASRNGISLTTQATMLLRQALARTMETEEVKARVRAHNANRNHATWLLDTSMEHAIEKEYTENHAETTTTADAR